MPIPSNIEEREHGSWAEFDNGTANQTTKRTFERPFGHLAMSTYIANAVSPNNYDEIRNSIVGNREVLHFYKNGGLQNALEIIYTGNSWTIRMTSITFSYLLKQDGSYLLRQDGGKIIL